MFGALAVPVLALVAVGGYFAFGNDAESPEQIPAARNPDRGDADILRVREERRRLEKATLRAKKELAEARRQALADARRLRREQKQPSPAPSPLSGPELYRRTLRSTVFVAVK